MGREKAENMTLGGKWNQGLVREFVRQCRDDRKHKVVIIANYLVIVFFM
jgi:hypothetical protein